MLQFVSSRTTVSAITKISKRLTNATRSNTTNLQKCIRHHYTASTMQTHIMFGANTDVGKTLVSAGLVRSALRANPSSLISYIKPLQCGGNDESSVSRYAIGDDKTEEARLIRRILFSWDTPASPHLASRVENKPVSDEEALSSVEDTLSYVANEGVVRTIVETAGGVLSPSSASPQNAQPGHARGLSSDTSARSWGWSTQADLYQPLNTPAVLVGDGRLGGISCTLSALESLIFRGYDVHGIILLDDGGGYDNVTALREYASRNVESQIDSGNVRFQCDVDQSIVSLPAVPPMPEPLYEWYDSPQVEETFESFHEMLENTWKESLEKAA